MDLQILTEVQTMKGQLRDLRTILMGHGEEGETAYGRLPMVEAKVQNVEHDIKRIRAELADIQHLRRTAGWAGNWVSHLLSSAVGAVIVLIVSRLLK